MDYSILDNAGLVVHRPVHTSVHLSNGYSPVLDVLALDKYLNEMAQAINFHSGFSRWAVKAHPELLQEYQTKLVADRLEK